MQFLTAKTVLQLRVLGLLILLFLLLKDPVAVFNSNFAMLLGQAMRLPTVVVSPENPLLGLLSLFIAAFALSDLIPAMAENTSHFDTWVPIRLAFFFMLGAFCMISEYGPLANNVMFTYSFFEIWLNFLIFNNLRDEKYRRAKEFLEKHGDDMREMASEQVRPIENDE